MSRSRKAPYCTDNGPHRKITKRCANKSVRNKTDVANGSAYKKEYNSWNISDFSFKETEAKPNTRKWWKARSK